MIDDGRQGPSQRYHACGDLVLLVLDLVLSGARQPDVGGIAEKIELLQAGKEDERARVRADDHAGWSRRENATS
jgi:hypothetical protein